MGALYACFGRERAVQARDAACAAALLAGKRSIKTLRNAMLRYQPTLPWKPEGAAALRRMRRESRLGTITDGLPVGFTRLQWALTCVGLPRGDGRKPRWPAPVWR